MAGPDGEDRGGLFEHLETVRQPGFGDRWWQPPLHERIQAYIDEIDPRRDACSADLRGRTPGETRRVSPSSVRMNWLYEGGGFAAAPDESDHVRFGPDVTLTRETRDDGRVVGYDRVLERLKDEDEDVDGEDILPVTYLDTEAQDELAERLPRYCPSCGADRVRVSITFEAGEPVRTELQCSECEPGAGQA